MSIQSEITRLETAKSDIATAITNKGVTVPSGTKLDGMAALIGSIESGGANFQTKSVTYTENGTSTITPDDGYDGLSSVDVTVDVASGGGGGAGFKVTFPATATNWSTVERARLVMYDGTFVDMADYSVIAGQTVNGVIGIQCQSRSNYPFHVLKMAIEKGAIAYHDSSFIPNTRIRVAQAGESTITPYGANTGNFWWPIVDTVISSIEMYNTD